MSNFLLIRAAIFTDNTATTNSRCGAVTYFFGVTLDFLIKRQQWKFPNTLTSHKYVDCPKPSSDTSEKWWSDDALIVPKPCGLMHIFMQIFSKLSNCFSRLPIFDRCCQEPFHPNNAWLDTNLEEAFFLAREMGMPTQEDHILNL